MKKLMFAAATVAVAGGAFADPLVYDYKASVKHMYAKEIKVSNPAILGGGKIEVYQKYQKSASLKGYLIVDTDGATSPTICFDQITNNPEFNTMGYGSARPATSASDFGRNRAFLVVQNNSAEKVVRFPKLLPAVIDAKWIDTKFKVTNLGRRVPATSGIAEGYLYVGGDFGAATRPQLDLLIDPANPQSTYPADRVVDALGGPNPNLLPQARMIGDYRWQSLWLFGKYNMPLVATAALTNWQNVQAAIEANLPLPNGYVAGRPFFHDAWLNGAGFGKYVGGSKKLCCGNRDLNAPVLQTLSGNLKGGLFLCTENGDVIDGGQYFKFAAGNPADFWEDQFFCVRSQTGLATYELLGDIEQHDLWQDGELELNTSDVISGSWSIKLVNTNPTATVSYQDMQNLNNGVAFANPLSEDAPNLLTLLETIKGAAQKLNSQVIFSNGKEITNMNTTQLGNLVQPPMITPAFANYYGFQNFR